MTQIVLNISSQKKWIALKSVLEAMDIDYITEDLSDQFNEKEQALLKRAEDDKINGSLNIYTSHRDLLRG